MNIISWNIRSRNDPIKQIVVNKIVTSHDVHIIGIMGNKVRIQRMEPIINKCFPSWQFIHNASVLRHGRIIFCWNPSMVKVQPLRISEQALTCELVGLQEQHRFILTIVYGENENEPRRLLWHELNTTKASIGQSPWAIMRDFNIIRYHSEKFGGGYGDAIAIAEFQDCIEQIDVDDCPTKATFLLGTIRAMKRIGFAVVLI